MRSILIVVFTAISLFQCYSQNIFQPGKKLDYKSLKPVARQVLADIRTNKNFARFEIFQVNHNESLNNSLKAGADSFVVIDIKQNALNSLLSLRPQNLALSIPNINGGITELLLFRHEISPADFQVNTSSGKIIQGNELRGLHYWGIIKDQYNSIVAISIFENEVMGFMANGSGNIVIGKLKSSEKHVVYNDQHLKGKNKSICENTLPTNSIVPPVKKGAGAPSTIRCVRIYWEVNFDIYLDKLGAFPTINFATGLFNQSQIIYFNDNIDITLSGLKIWDTISPYGGTSSSDWLYSFGFYLSVFNGDVAHLLSYGTDGGIGYLYGLCGSWELRQCYSGLSASYQDFPVYSWNVDVITHEQGHVIGSPHTHDCVWNNDNTAIDGCGPAGGYDGNGDCPDGPIPAKGTIMSYCHLSQNPGKDFSLGFGPQPAELLIFFVNDAYCLSDCSPCIPVESNDNCNNAELLKLDSVCNFISGSICNATPDFNTGYNCTLNGENNYTFDVWYKFIATCPEVAIKIKSSSIFDPVCEIYDSPCGLQLGDCTNITGPGQEETIFLPNLTLGQTYYIRIYDFFQSQNSGFLDLPDFEICAVCSEALPNLTADLSSGISNVIIDGNILDITIDVTNNGFAASSNPTNLTYYISEDPTIESTDTKMEIDYIKKLEVNEHTTVKFKNDVCNFLKDKAFGTYYIGFIIDNDNFINEFLETDNTWNLIPMEVDCNESATTSILENKIQLFPNPVSDKLIIKGDDLDNGNLEVMIINAIGQKVKEVSNKIIDQNFEIEIDLKELNSGIYFICLKSNDLVYTYKVSKI